MRMLRWMSRIEKALCAGGFLVMSLALVADVASRLTLGYGIVGAPQLGLVGMLVTAMFGVGLAADAGEHFRPRVLDKYRPATWEGAMGRIGHALTSVFFVVLAGVAAYVAWESWLLDDVTSLLRWPVWLLQGAIVIALAFNAVRYAVFSGRPDAAPSQRVDA